MSQEVMRSSTMAKDGIIFRVEKKLNGNVHIEGIATACEKQCIHCHVNSKKLGRTRS